MKKLVCAVCALLVCAVPAVHAATKKPAPKKPAAAAPAAAPTSKPAPTTEPAAKEQTKEQTKEQAAPKPKPARAVITQGDFVAKLFEAFHWGAGLPDEPKDADYRTVIAGIRTFTYEAEEQFDRDRDGVTVRNFPLYGPFTGTGWLNGVATATTVHFKFLLPIEGVYQLMAHAKGDGQRWKLDAQKFTVSGGDRFTTVAAGTTVPLEAGFHEITVELPPEGAIDSFTLTAPPVASVSPLGGWRSDRPLTVGDMAQAGAALLGLEPSLPVDGASPVQRVAAMDVAASAARVELTNRDFFGTFFSPQWVRAGMEGARVELPFTVAERGVYSLRLRYLGSGLQAELDGHPVTTAVKPYFEWVDLGTRRLEPGRHLLTLQLPPTAGVDLLELQRLRAAPADYQKLAGLDGSPDATVSDATADAFVTALKERFKERR